MALAAPIPLRRLRSTIRVDDAVFSFKLGDFSGKLLTRHVVDVG
jgi:hypothetical protein